MDLKNLERLKELNELDLLYEIVSIAQKNYKDAENVIKQNRSKASGIRLRDSMQDIRLISETIRDLVQMRKGVEWGEKRKFALDKAIEEEKIRIEKEKKIIEKIKADRLAKINK